MVKGLTRITVIALLSHCGGPYDGLLSTTEGAVCDESGYFGRSWACCNVESFCLWWLPCVVLDAEFSGFLLYFFLHLSLLASFFVQVW